jgi:hypothetical protein
LRIAALGCLVGLLLTWPGLARAQTAPRATLVVTRGAGAEDCPDADGIAQRVAAITGAQTLQTKPLAPSETWVHLELSRDVGRYAAMLQLRGRHQGSRNLADVSPDCSSLADAVAVTLALFFDSKQTQAPAPKPALRVEARPPPPPVREPRYAVQLGGGVGFGLLSEPSPLATLGIDLTPKGVFRVGVGGGLALPDRVRYLNGFTELRLAFGYARGCAEALGKTGGFQLMLCMAPLLGALSGAGNGYDFTTKKRWFWAALTGGPQVLGPLAKPAFWWLSASALVPLTLRGFAVTTGDASRDVFSVPPFGVIASLGLGAQF